MGTHPNRLDAKGRVSVPAAFRSILRELSGSDTATMILRPSHQGAFVEGWAVATFDTLAGPLDQMDVFSESHDAMAASLYAEAVQMDADREGRVVLPESLVAHANIVDTMVFIGLGSKFTIWEPAAGAAFSRDAAEKTRLRGITLPGTRGA